MKIEQYIDLAGFYRVLWQMANGENISLKFNHDPSDAECLAQETKYMELHQYDAFSQLRYELLDNIDLLHEVVTLLKENPTVNLTQYNNYLSTKTWYEQAIVNYFLFTVAVGLAENYGVTLVDFTAAEVLKEVRDWIVATPAKKIAKILFGE